MERRFMARKEAGKPDATRRPRHYGPWQERYQGRPLRVRADGIARENRRGSDVETFDLAGTVTRRFRRAMDGLRIGDQPRKAVGK
jgi:hypothetical protein